MRRLPYSLRIGLVLLGVFCVLVLAVYLAERPAQSRAGRRYDVLDALSMVLFLLGGDPGTDDPLTDLGRVLRLITFVLGVGLVAVVIGRVAVYIMQRQKEAGVHPDTEGHIIICGWNSRGDRIVRELHAPDAAPETTVCIITEKETNEKLLRDASPVEYENVYFVRQDPTSHSVLKQQRAHRARSVIILMDEDCPDPDGKAALIALAISNLERESALPRKPHIVAEVGNHRKVEHLKDAGVDEWVCAHDFGLGILAQAALTQKITEVYQHLLSRSPDTNELYIVGQSNYPAQLVGKSFAEAASLISRNRSTHNPVLLLGVRRGERLIMNPKGHELERIEPNDALVVMAYEAPNLVLPDGATDESQG